MVPLPDRLTWPFGVGPSLPPWGDLVYGWSQSKLQPFLILLKYISSSRLRCTFGNSNAPWDETHLKAHITQISLEKNSFYFSKRPTCPMFFLLNVNIQSRAKVYMQLLNKPYVKEVTLTGQSPPLKCFQPLEILTHFIRGLGLWKLVTLQPFNLQTPYLQNWKI